MSQIIEIAFEIESQEDWDFLDSLLARIRISYYVEPSGHFKTLEEVEIQCEGK